MPDGKLIFSPGEAGVVTAKIFGLDASVLGQTYGGVFEDTDEDVAVPEKGVAGARGRTELVELLDAFAFNVVEC